MQRILFLLALLCLEKTLHAQYIYTIKADSVKITNSCDTAELIIENHTQTVPGFLFNKGRGRTEFRRGMVKSNDSTFIIGGDTLKINPWLQGGNAFGAIGKFGTLDNNPIDFYTNNIARGRWSQNGNFIIGNAIEDTQKLQVYGDSYFKGKQQVTGFSSVLNNSSHTLFNPTVTGIPIPGQVTYFSGVKYSPDLKFSADYQQAYAVDISPTYYLNNYNQNPDDISAALHVQSGLGGIRIDQFSAHDGYSGQPLYIQQAGSSMKEFIRNYRNGTESTRAFIWNTDNRSAGNKSSVIPAVRSTLLSGAVDGSGVSFTLDRFYWEPDASIELKYEMPYADSVNTSIGFKTLANNYHVIPLFLKGDKVGIGTTAPSAQLQATGSVRFSGLTSNNSFSRVVVSDASGNLYYRDVSFGALNETMNSDLAVNCRISAQQMLITQTGRWPDYVFSKQYKLPALSEVERFINQNSHLPGIPSAAEVEKKGIDVGNNQAAMLKKIEELTLYIIDQDKTIKKQNNQYNELKQEMAELKALIKSK